MARGELSKQQISALSDGELPDHEVDAVIKALTAPGGRSDWDVYHQIGDVLRSEAMAQPLSAGFSDRFAARLDAEPPLVVPRLRLCDRLRERLPQVWPVSATVMAAALTGFVIAPQLMRDDARDRAVPTTAGETVSHASVIAKADIASSGIASSEASAPAVDDYIRIHHSSHPSPYGVIQLARPVDLNSASDH